MKTVITHIKTQDEQGEMHLIEHHQPKKVSHTLDGPETFNGLAHYEYKGSRINPPKNNVFDLNGKKATIVT